jgi:hypothetical protein
MLSNDVYDADSEPESTSKTYLGDLDIVGSYRTTLIKLYRLTMKGIAYGAFKNKLKNYKRITPKII